MRRSISAKPRGVPDPSQRRPRGPSSPLAVLAEGRRIAGSQPVLSLALTIISAGVVLVTLSTTGQTVGAERAVLARFDDAGTRAIQLVDNRAVPLVDHDELSAITRLDAVSWAIGLGPIEDVRPAGLPGADAVPARRLVGDSPDLDYRQPDTADTVALVGAASQRALGLVAAAGVVESVTARQYPVGGSFTATGALSDLAGSVLLVGGDPSTGLRRVTIEVTDAGSVQPVADALRALVGPPGPDGVEIEVSADLVLARDVVRGEFAGYGRGILTQALASGLALMIVAVLAGVNARRRDFGRRRALGASRGQLFGIVIAQSLWSSVPGVVVGAAVGSLAVRWLAGTWPGWQFPVAVALLTTMSAAAAAAVPAAVAAWRDPVSALRVP